MSPTSRAAYLEEKAERLQARQHDLDADRTKLQRRKGETHELGTRDRGRR
jgi:hypothetical protein